LADIGLLAVPPLPVGASALRRGALAPAAYYRTRLAAPAARSCQRAIGRGRLRSAPTAL